MFDGTLLLIFSVSLVIWGLLVNRKRAWRFDGGTAAFGAGATILAIVSTAINFVEVKEDTINWLQNLLWAIVLWQSWLGFWWWVGSGMGVGEVEVSPPLCSWTATTFVVLSAFPPPAIRIWYRKRRRKDCETKDVVKREEGEIVCR